MPALNPESDLHWMSLALEQARQGIGFTSPNPAVGAVIVAEGELIGQGFHRQAGQPHAEIEALKDARIRAPERIAGSTIYVTLEPCSTQGRTGPCTSAIQAAGITRVVWGAQDPNPSHVGRAQQLLESAGIAVTTGILESECQEILRPFAKWITTGLPYVIAKAGQSLDGRITRPPGEGPWITSEAARAHSQGLRARVDAILVGAETVRQDNPRLTLRNGSLKPQPFRIILTRSGHLPADAYVFTDAYQDRTLVLRDLAFPEVLRDLAARGITSVLIEGGSNVLGQAFAARCVDEVCWYIAPRLCGGGLPVIGGPDWQSSVALENVTLLPIGDNLCLTGRPVWPNLESDHA
ncbi:bifunctional diaminohydroxyphosphoribosylaminopyrimidine deaminase/5-amino-6-(5-phosphoribosylamino)uracil reductase RibD [Prosthecobacter dejongeii]|uniref:Riboflavin biosynthesis protein RibD n=1 Tax=Prosthecobacter dejongeii TaxID=48465 RepID=A0A7W7YHQ7_9BACT|nr:bifunctional diaminohydroxyphosphoribosylaminopyrimidine deaminase/5-amino-6-(5-phosphoribosylamino)uracil reductase RibD [Prosthecobacter dejongeii]MBB5036329.1 diaminohydroxyphosphoribosylaminopyrimidine deaminase/5-amino-6-(5-phosphoribosylamino)uracil reductase [Prosthecobacter dejongeii]